MGGRLIGGNSTESRISRELQHYSNLPVQPDVTAGGFPFLYEAERGKLSSLTVDAQDLDVPGFGLVTVHSSATNIEASTHDILHGRIEDAPVETVSTTLSLDGLALGERLGITESDYPTISEYGTKRRSGIGFGV